MSYDCKYVAFLDILGFKDMVNKSSNKYSNNGKDTIHDALNYMNSLNSEASNQNNLDGRVLWHVSDSIILCNSNFAAILSNVAFLQSHLATYNIFLRGGLTFGEIMNRNSQQPIYGPALIEAYNLENEKAIYPRVIIGSNAYKKRNDLLTNKKFLKKDEDGVCFVDWKSLALTNRELTPSRIEEIKTHVNHKLRSLNMKRSNSQPQIYIKYKWLKSYIEALR